MTDDTKTCFAQSCDKDATHKLKYDESGTPRTYKYACREHKNMETIHDPFGVTAKPIDA